MCMKALGPVILGSVMKMKDNKELLSSIHSTTQMGQVGIRSVLNASLRPGLRKALESQLREYDTIEREAQAIATARGWELRDVEPAVKGMANMMVRARIASGNTDSKVAAMMIQGNTRGMIVGLKDLHQFNGADPQVSVLSQRLLDCENANIRQMQSFL